MTTRRQLLQKAAAAAPALMIGGKALGSATSAQATVPSAAAGKNIILFITDQDRAIQHFPEGWAERNLPGLTRLKQNGISFENAFCNSCMCSPSRATMFTGCYPAQHGVKYTLEEDMPAEKYPQVELPTDMENLASVMSSAGYEVVYKGKWHLSKPAGQEFETTDLLPYGFTRWNPPDAGGDQSIEQEGGGKNDNDGRFMDSVGSVEDNAEGVLQYLRSKAGATKPFCLVVSLVNPHDVLLYPNNYIEGGYDDSWLEGEIDLPETVYESLKTKPDAQANFLRIFNLSGKLDDDEMKRAYLNFYGNLMKHVDGYLVDVMDTLDSIGLTDDTIVIRTSDHGEMGLAHGGLRQKNFNVYEETLRVPMVYSNPKLIQGGTTSDVIVSHVDLLPTLAGLVGAPGRRRSAWKGKDYSPLILGRRMKPARQEVIFTFDDYQAGQKTGPYVKPPQHIVALRERDWKIAKYYDADREVPPQWELYDLKNDPLESRNLAHRSAHRNARQQAAFKRLKRRLRQIERRELQPLPHQTFQVRSTRLEGDDVVTRFRAPGRGTVVQKVTTQVRGRRVELGSSRRKVRYGGDRRMRCDLSEDLLRDLKREGKVELKVKSTFRPNGGTPVTEISRIVVRAKRVARRDAVAA